MWHPDISGGRPAEVFTITDYMKKIILFPAIILALLCPGLMASQFEELDKPPEGAHEGQMLLGGFVSIGIPYGDIIDAEKDFLRGNTYVFEESEITKELVIAHLSYDFGIAFEYMPIDYVGLKAKLKRVLIVQRTRFGADFQNWTETLYSNYSLLFGPSFHLTSRKSWDVTLTPVIGYAFAKYNATPIAAKLVQGYSGDRERDVSGITYGAEINLTMYFSGGLYISLGVDWNKYPITFSPPYELTQPGNGNTFMEGKNSGSIQTINLAISAGYAFSH
jgi:hypothetical protein